MLSSDVQQRFYAQSALGQTKNDTAIATDVPRTSHNLAVQRLPLHYKDIAFVRGEWARDTLELHPELQGKQEAFKKLKMQRWHFMQHRDKQLFQQKHLLRYFKSRSNGQPLSINVAVKPRELHVTVPDTRLAEWWDTMDANFGELVRKKVPLDQKCELKLVLPDHTRISLEEVGGQSRHTKYSWALDNGNKNLFSIDTAGGGLRLAGPAGPLLRFLQGLRDMQDLCRYPDAQGPLLLLTLAPTEAQELTWWCISTNVLATSAQANDPAKSAGIQSGRGHRRILFSSRFLNFVNQAKAAKATQK